MTDRDTLIDAAFTAIRTDAEVGPGTCSIFDEAYTDDELREWIVERVDGYSFGAFRAEGLTTVEAIVAYARESNDLHWERARDVGETDAGAGDLDW